jgi:stage V sporulation protein AA
MHSSSVYVRMRLKVGAEPNQQIKIGDLAKIIAEDELKSEIENIQIHQVNMRDKNFVVIDVMQVIREICRYHGDLDIQTVGPTQTIISVQYKKKRLAPVYFILVWLLLFIGAGLAIMNFHEDVSMQAVHQKIYYLITGKTNEYPLLLQVPYSIGLGLGMVLFFNHVFRKKLNEEPSPLDVEMFNYQQDLDQYVIIHELKESEKERHDS